MKKKKKNVYVINTPVFRTYNKNVIFKFDKKKKKILLILKRVLRYTIYEIQFIILRQ